jgi:hypothetical protein
MIGLGADMHAGGRGASLHRRGRRAMAETTEMLAAVVNVDTSSSVASIFINSVLHLSKKIVDLDQILLGSGVGCNGKIVLLSQRVLGRRRTSLRHGWTGWLGQIALRSSSHWAAGNRKTVVKREKRTTNLAVGRGVDLAALGAVEKVIHHVIGALAVKRRGLASSGISKMLGTLVVHCGLVEVQSIVGRRLGSVVAAWMRLMLIIRSHLAIVIIVAGRLVHMGPVVDTTLLRLWSVLGGTDQNRVVGMSLDMLLQVLGALERLATELALVRLEGNMNTDMRSNVVALHSSGATRVPVACEIQIVCALATNMALTDVLIERLWCGKLLVTVTPAAGQGLLSSS